MKKICWEEDILGKGRRKTYDDVSDVTHEQIDEIWARVESGELKAKELITKKPLLDTLYSIVDWNGGYGLNMFVDTCIKSADGILHEILDALAENKIAEAQAALDGFCDYWTCRIPSNHMTRGFAYKTIV